MCIVGPIYYGPPYYDKSMPVAEGKKQTQGYIIHCSIYFGFFLSSRLGSLPMLEGTLPVGERMLQVNRILNTVFH